MRVLIFVLLVGLVAFHVEAKRKRKFEGDFEFDEEDESKAGKSAEKKHWIHDPSSDLCRPLNCKKKEICLLEDSFTAVCVSRKELKKNGDVVVPKAGAKPEDPTSKNDDEEDVFYDSEDDADDEANDDASDSNECRPCPVVKPIFLCGSDNRTYSSLCRMDYHNCIHHSTVKVSCKGFCPCKAEPEIKLRKKQRQSERLNNFISKYRATLDKSGTGGSISSSNPEKPSKKDVVYSFVPQDIKYDNKHYKYIKYTQFNKDNMLYGEDKDKLRGYNEVTDEKAFSNAINGLDPATSSPKQCPATALQAMGNRLLDWFSVVMADSSKRRRPRSKSRVRFTPSCRSEVRWMFQHLDENADSKLSVQELYDLEHDKGEGCLKSYLQQCDLDKDLVITSIEWCKCFAKADRSCAALRRIIISDAFDVYVPECDNLGFYKPIQCHEAIGMCWCVDKHGVEFANTRTHSKPNCNTIMTTSAPPAKKPESRLSNSLDGGSDDEDDDQEVEGSADHPTEY
ncbi:proteoglycan Cow isoform X1 [Dendroctonus ponderosae]|uniref:proteoglycan Cow isoform X1 n=1 Tax=Dendroctonus ponderosae TaxID=77166 RepID=UPI002035858E|nr:proteoglycan Cow isoform X1 [Dendroctonus ponderosae]